MSCLRQCGGFDLGFLFFVSWFRFFFFLVIVSLDSPWRRLSCFETEALALLSPSLICYIYKLSERSQMWYTNRLRQQEQEEPEYSTWEPLLLSQTDTVIYGVSDPLAFEELRPSHVSLVFISVVLVTLCPKALQWFSGPCGAREEGPPPPFLRRETRSRLRSWERRGKWVACFVTALHTLSHLTRPGQCSWFKRARKLFFKGRVSVLTVTEWKCFDNPLF